MTTPPGPEHDQGAAAWEDLRLLYELVQRYVPNPGSGDVIAQLLASVPATPANSPQPPCSPPASGTKQDLAWELLASLEQMCLRDLEQPGLDAEYIRQRQEMLADIRNARAQLADEVARDDSGFPVVDEDED